MRHLAFVISLLFASESFAGSGPADLSCTGVNSSISLKGLIPASEIDLDLTLRDKDGEIRMGMDKEGDADVIENFKQGVFTLSISGQGEIRLYALPKTIKAKVTYHSTTATFQAVLQTALKPERRDKSNRTADDYYHNVKMNCRYSYSI